MDGWIYARFLPKLLVQMWRRMIFASKHVLLLVEEMGLKEECFNFLPSRAKLIEAAKYMAVIGHFTRNLLY